MLWLASSWIHNLWDFRRRLHLLSGWRDLFLFAFFLISQVLLVQSGLVLVSRVLNWFDCLLLCCWWCKQWTLRELKRWNWLLVHVHILKLLIFFRGRRLHSLVNTNIIKCWPRFWFWFNITFRTLNSTSIQRFEISQLGLDWRFGLFWAILLRWSFRYLRCSSYKLTSILNKLKIGRAWFCL
jgi:hypothetical protein